MKISLLALVSTVAAVPQYGYGHSKFHSLKPSATEGYGYETAYGHSHSAYGTGKPYPTGGYPMGRNSTRVPHPTGGYAEGTTTIDVTSTSTKTIVKTVHVSPSPAPGNYETSVAAVVQAVSNIQYDQCGPATVTVTASEKVTVTVGDYEAASSAPAYKPSSAYVAPAQSSAYVAVPPSAAAAPSSKPAEGGYSAPAPKPVEPTSSKMVVPVYTSAAPKPVEPTSSKVVVPVYTSAAPSAKPTPSAPATGSYSGTKRGLAYNDASLIKDLGGKYGFAWNWGQTEGNDLGSIMYIPTMHKPSDSTPEAWLANVDKAVKKGSTAVMGFNECDISTQCAMSPADACAAWKQYMNPIKAKYPQVTILGPSVSNSGAESQGLDWLTQFHSVCPDAIVDATNIHFYSIYQDKTNTQYSTTIERLQTQVETAAKNYGKKVWLTEYGLNPGSATADQAATFLQESLTYLDNAPEVQGYSYFMVGTDQSQYQLCEAGAASPLGKIYSS